MKLLVIGGTMFLGKHCVEVALKREHEVTLFNRGKHGAELFPSVERIVGDRATELGLLEGRKWDAVLDTCGYVPRIVKLSAEALVDAVAHYTFVSSISVYADMATPNQDEDAPVGQLEDDTEEVTGEGYGPLKALCENVVLDAFPDRALVTRPTLIVGPDDPTDRFAYWPARFAKGGRVLVPNRREQPAQVIDVRDLAEWTVRLIETQVTGVFNAAGPETPLTMGGICEACQRSINPTAEIAWVDEPFLLEHGVSEWADLPLWIAEKSNGDGMESVDISRALNSGLTFRPLDDTLRDTLAWCGQRPADYTWRGGLSTEREAEVLAKWDSA